MDGDSAVKAEELPAEAAETKGTKRPADESVTAAPGEEAPVKKTKVEEQVPGEEAAPGEEPVATAPAPAAEPAPAFVMADPTPPPLAELPHGFSTGTVKWYDATKGYGFIAQEGDENDDVFVHETCLPPRASGTKGLADKEEVWFRITVEDGGRLRANDITGPYGVPTKGVAQPTMQIMGGNEQMVGLPVAAASNEPRVFPDHTTEELPAGRKRGKTKWFNTTKGFGFLAPDDGTEDIFVHQSNILCAPGAFRSLADGENLEYEIMEEASVTRSKRKAHNVTGPGGQPVVGCPRPSAQQAPAITPMAAANPYAYAANPYAAYYAQQQAAYAAPAATATGAAQGQSQEHAAAWQAYYAQQAAAAAAAQQQPQAQQADQPAPGSAEHTAAWQAYYAQQAAAQQQGAAAPQ